MEFAFWLPILVLVLSGIVDMGWYMSRYHLVNRAARDGARVAADVLERRDNPSPGSDIEAAAEAHAEALLEGVGMPCDTAACIVEATWEDSLRDTIAVRVTYPFEPLFGVAPIHTSMTAEFAMLTRTQRDETVPIN